MIILHNIPTVVSKQCRRIKGRDRKRGIILFLNMVTSRIKIWIITINIGKSNHYIKYDHDHFIIPSVILRINFIYMMRNILPRKFNFW